MSGLDKDAFIRCHEALHVICTSVLPCVKATITKWHIQMQQTLGHCASPSNCASIKGKPRHGPRIGPGGIPRLQSCSNCVAWGKAIMDVEYTNSSKGVVSAIAWNNIDPCLLSQDPVEIAKAFVLRLPKELPTPKAFDEFDTAGLLMVMLKFKPFHQGNWNDYCTIKEIFDIRNSISHLKQKEKLHLGHEAMESNFRHINTFLDRLHKMHPNIYNFAVVFDMRVKLNNVRRAPITQAMKDDALKPLTEAVKEAVHQTLKEEFRELKQDLKHGFQENRQKKEVMQSVDEEFDLTTFKKDLLEIYEEELGRMLLLPWNKEFGEMRFMDDIYVELELVENKTILTSNADLVELKTRQDKLARRIMVKGLPGSGKSCLMSKIAYEWSKQNSASPLSKFEIVFLLRVKDLRSNQNVTDAISQQILKVRSVLSGLQNYINHNQEKILILADGLDENNLQVETRNLQKGTQTVCMEQILANEALRKCSVIVTSRPHKSLGAAQSKYYSLVEIRGFSPDKSEAYIGKFFSGKDNEHVLIKSLVDSIRCSHLLRAIAKVPMILMLLCILWEDQKTFPDTYTMLYDEFIKAMWNRFLLIDQTTQEVSLTNLQLELGKRALHGLLPRDNVAEDVLEFLEEDFGEIAELGFKVGLITKQRWKFRLEEKTSVSFIHKSLQEFCAASFLLDMFINSRKQFDTVLSRIATWDIVLSKFELLRFCCGLSANINQQLPSARIIDHVTQKYKEMVDTKSESTIEVITRINVGSSEDTDVFPLLALFYEAKVKPSSKLASSVTDYIFPDVGSVKIHCNHPQALVVYQQFQCELGRSLGENIESIEFKHVNSGSFGAMSKIFKCMPNVDELDISGRFDNEVHADTMTEFGTQIASFSNLSTLRISDELCCTLNIFTILVQLAQSPNKLLRYIEFTKVNIGDAICRLRNVITHQLEHLILLNAALVEKHIEALSSFLPQAPNLSMLDLSWNVVGKSVVQLASHLKSCRQLQRLNLSDAHLSGEGIVALAENFQYWPDFRRIDLRSNEDIGNNGLAAVFMQIHHCPELTELQVSTRIKGQCSDLVKDCLSAIEIAVPVENSVVKIHAWQNDIQSIQNIGRATSSSQ